MRSKHSVLDRFSNDSVKVIPKILLVDDRRENLLALQVTLRDEGYDLVEVNSGAEAYQQTLLHEFAAILLDVQMPVLDGFETAKLIRTVAQAKTTPIIFVTAIHQTEMHARAGYEAGAIDYLFKPINPDVLKAKLSILVDLYNKNQELRIFSRKLKDQIVRETENKMLKEQLISRDEFLSMASHELKTPITPLNLQLQSFLKMIRSNTLKDIENDRLERMLLTAHTQVERLSETIDKLLDVSRFATGRVEMNLERVNLTELVKKTIRFVEIQLQRLGCDYFLEAEDDVYGVWDAFRIEQVVLNVLANAMKYGPGKPIHIQVQSLNGHAYIKIKDHGIGIAENDQTRIFERFERAASSSYYGGLGLGLFIACEIVRHHRGSIKVDSKVGDGATFIIKLPQDNRPDRIYVPI